MVNPTEPQPVEHELEISAPPETVFSFLVDPTRMLEWIGQAVELDPRPGGIVRIDVNGRDIVVGRVVEVDAPRFLAFTWGWERDDAEVPRGGSRVEIRLEARGDGTLLRLRHLHLPPEVRDEHAEGWRHYLARLRVVAQGGNPGPDPLADTDIVHGAPGSFPGEPGELEGD